MQTTGRIQNHDVVLVAAGVFDRFLRGDDRVLRAALKDRHANLTAHDLQLLDGGRAIDIAADEQRTLAVLLEPGSQLSGHRRLTGALQTAEHEHGYRRRAVLEPRVAAAHQRRQLFVDDLDDLLLRAQAL